MKQDFSGEALSKQNTEASLASLSWLVPGDDRVVRHRVKINMISL